MAMFIKMTRTVKSVSGSLLNCKTEQSVLRSMSNCSCDGDDKQPSLPTIGCDNPSDPTMYDVRKYGHQLPQNDVTPKFELLKDIPSGVFRCTEGEILGLGAGKGCCYQNPEYFSFNHMTFFDMHLHLRGKRLPQPDTKRKPP